MNTIVERNIKGLTICAVCSEAYARAAENVLDAFEKLAQSGMTLEAGTEIRFGWTLLRLAEASDKLRVTEPDFAHWPQERWSPSIGTSLQVLVAQVKLLHRLDVDGEDAWFDQFVIAAPGALAEPKVFLRRANSSSAEDSGWLLGSVNDPEGLARATDLERIAIASFVQRRPALLQSLTLPPGFIVVFSGDSIEQIFDAAGREMIKLDAEIGAMKGQKS